MGAPHDLGGCSLRVAMLPLPSLWLEIRSSVTAPTPPTFHQPGHQSPHAVPCQTQRDTDRCSRPSLTCRMRVAATWSSTRSRRDLAAGPRNPQHSRPYEGGEKQEEEDDSVCPKPQTTLRCGLPMKIFLPRGQSLYIGVKAGWGRGRAGRQGLTHGGLSECLTGFLGRHALIPEGERGRELSTRQHRMDGSLCYHLPSPPF